jgi:hypothetical protein
MHHFTRQHEEVVNETSCNFVAKWRWKIAFGEKLQYSMVTFNAVRWAWDYLMTNISCPCHCAQQWTGQSMTNFKADGWMSSWAEVLRIIKRQNPSLRQCHAGFLKKKKTLLHAKIMPHRWNFQNTDLKMVLVMLFAIPLWQYSHQPVQNTVEPLITDTLINEHLQ